MEKFIKENWFKISIVVILLIVIILVSYYFFIFNQKQLNKSFENTAVNIPVNILSTSDGLTGLEMYEDKYPKNIAISGMTDLINQVSAYGASYHVWIGPKGWTGEGGSGVDGNASVNLYPMGGSTDNGPHVSYFEVPACYGCILEGAAPYFVSATQDFNKTYNENGANPIKIPKGLEVTPISSTLVTYTLPDIDGLKVYGVVYYNANGVVHYDANDKVVGGESNHVPFESAEFVLPKEQSDLSNFLLQTFILKENLK